MKRYFDGVAKFMIGLELFVVVGKLIDYREHAGSPFELLIHIQIATLLCAVLIAGKQK